MSSNAGSSGSVLTRMDANANAFLGNLFILALNPHTSSSNRLRPLQLILNHGLMGLLSFPVDIPIRIDGRYKLQEPIGSGSYGKNRNSYYTLDKHTYLHFRKERFI